MTRLKHFVLLTLALGFGIRARAAVNPEGLFADPVLAKGKSLEIKRSHLEEAFIAYRANLAARGQNVPENKRTELEAQLLDRIIINQLLIQRATDAERAKGREKADKFVAETRQG